MVDAAAAKEVEASTKRSGTEGVSFVPRTQSPSILLSPEIFSEKASKASAGVTTPRIRSVVSSSPSCGGSFSSFSSTRTQFWCEEERTRKASARLCPESQEGTDVRGFITCCTDKARAFSAATEDFAASIMPLAMSRADSSRAFKGRPQSSFLPSATCTSKWWQENWPPCCSDMSLAASTREVVAGTVMGGTRKLGSRAKPSCSHL
mmetsp:Transcript_22438/g.50547  ORF Transcript_22438/g.50547 Transcript_22438/m.50547 type:complete len:206 (+) Transcript_22438:149-766(+)